MRDTDSRFRASDYLLFLPEKSPAPKALGNTGQGRQCINRERKDEQENELLAFLSTHIPSLGVSVCSCLIITFAKRSGHPT